MPPGASTNKAREDPTPIVPRRYLAALDATTGALLDWDAHPDGPVLSLAVSPDGRRLYLGGQFRNVGGRSTARLAAVDIDTGASDPTFTPPEPNAYVKAMALSGDRLFIGGAFNLLGTEARSQLAAVDAATGALRSDWIPPENTGGHFAGHTGVPDRGRRPRQRGRPEGHAGRDHGRGGRELPRLRRSERPRRPRRRDGPADGLAAGHGPPPPGLRPRHLARRRQTIFVAAGGWGGTVEAFRPGGSTEPLWIHRVDGDAMDVASTPTHLYLVGHYDYVLGDKNSCGSTNCTGGKEGDVPNHHISAFDPVTGAHDQTFTAQFNTPQGPAVALIGARHLYVGGDFTKVNFAPHPGFVQFPPAASRGGSSPPSATSRPVSSRAGSRWVWQPSGEAPHSFGIGL